MKNVLYHIAEISGLQDECFKESCDLHEKKIEMTYDPRIAGLQGVIDYIFSNGGEGYAPSVCPKC